MGSGKTSAMLNHMNDHPEERYLFITPYLDEIQRVVAACPGLKFQEPAQATGSSKKCDLERLLEQGANIASTHALFQKCTANIMQLIQDGGYILILDEAMNVIRPANVRRGDIQFLMGNGVASCRPGTNQIVWTDSGYCGERFRDLQEKATAGTLILYKDEFVFWSLPTARFRYFKEVYILTYMFRAQMQKYYYDLHGMELDYWSAVRVDGRYQITPGFVTPPGARELVRKVHILDHPKLNRIGGFMEDPDKRRCRERDPLTVPALSSSWYKRGGSVMGGVDQVSKNINNVLRHVWAVDQNDFMWTVFKSHADDIGRRGFKKSFVSCTARATNAYANRHYLAYCVNVYFDPRLKNYLNSRGVEVDENTYALSEMVQWIWRSAIRNGEDIWVYVPSMRMRTLLQGWLEALAEGRDYNQL